MADNFDTDGQSTLRPLSGSHINMNNKKDTTRRVSSGREDVIEMSDLEQEDLVAMKAMGIRGRNIDDDLQALRANERRLLLLDHLMNTEQGRTEFSDFIGTRGAAIKENNGIKDGRLYDKVMSVLMQMDVNKMEQEFPESSRWLKSERNSIDVSEEVDFYRENFEPDADKDENRLQEIKEDFQHQKQVDIKIGEPGQPSLVERLKASAKEKMNFRKDDGSLSISKIAMTGLAGAGAGLAVAGGPVGVAAFIGAKVARHYAAQAMGLNEKVDQQVTSGLAEKGLADGEKVENYKQTIAENSQRSKWKSFLETATLMGVGVAAAVAIGDIDTNAIKDNMSDLVSQGKDLFSDVSIDSAGSTIGEGVTELADQTEGLEVHEVEGAGLVDRIKEGIASLSGSSQTLADGVTRLASDVQEIDPEGAEAPGLFERIKESIASLGGESQTLASGVSDLASEVNGLEAVEADKPGLFERIQASFASLSGESRSLADGVTHLANETQGLDAENPSSWGILDRAKEMLSSLSGQSQTLASGVSDLASETEGLEAVAQEGPGFFDKVKGVLAGMSDSSMTLASGVTDPANEAAGMESNEINQPGVIEGLKDRLSNLAGTSQTLMSGVSDLANETSAMEVADGSQSPGLIDRLKEGIASFGSSSQSIASGVMDLANQTEGLQGNSPEAPGIFEKIKLTLSSLSGESQTLAQGVVDLAEETSLSAEVAAHNVDPEISNEALASVKGVTEGLGDAPELSEKAIDAAGLVAEGAENAPELSNAAIELANAVAEGITADPVTYTVQPGDTMSDFVLKQLEANGIQVSASELYGPDGILSQTGLDTDDIKPGQVIDVTALQSYIESANPEGGLQIDAPANDGIEVSQDVSEPSNATKGIADEGPVDSKEAVAEEAASDAKAKFTSHLGSLASEANAGSVYSNVDASVGGPSVEGGFGSQVDTGSPAISEQEALKRLEERLMSDALGKLDELGAGAGTINIEVGDAVSASSIVDRIDIPDGETAAPSGEVTSKGSDINQDNSKSYDMDDDKGPGGP